MSHPGFPEASRALAAGMLALSARDRVLGDIFRDAGRYVAAMCAFYLDADGGGLTLPRLKAICVRSGLLSPGRARNLLQLLEHLRYVEPGARGRGGKATTYRPTSTFLAAWEAQLGTALDAARRIEPAVAGVLDRLHEPEVLRTFARVHAEGLVTASGDGAYVRPFVQTFMHPYAGTQIVWVLIDLANDGTFPPITTGPVTLSGLARQFGVSRIHIKRIFDDGEREGLSKLEHGGEITLTPVARAQLSIIYGVQFAQLLSAA
ncbi:MAG TPA: hypothetical protein VFW13_09520, partial [Phenylobacterium sp.]|nr:hypothetical protein [Phenylobacterium sp.]